MMLYRVSVVMEVDDAAEVKEALVMKLEEMGFPVGGVLVTVEPAEIQLDVWSARALREAQAERRGEAAAAAAAGA